MIPERLTLKWGELTIGWDIWPTDSESKINKEQQLPLVLRELATMLESPSIEDKEIF